MGHEEEQQQQEGDSPCASEQLPRTASVSLRERIFRRRTWIIRLAGLALLLGSIIATAVTLGRRETIRVVVLWIHQNQVGGGFIFVLLYCWFTVVFLPVALLAICAGAVWGLWPGLPLVWVSAVLGETLAFLLGRFLLRKWVHQLTADWPLWQALNAALREDGWKLVALLRVSPATPFSAVSYALGTSSLSFWHYLLPSAIGIIPTALIETYLGAAAADITSVVSDEGVSAPAAAKIGVTVATAVTAVVGAVLSAVYTKRAIDRRLSHLQVTEQLAVTEQHVRLLHEGGPASTSSTADAGSPRVGGDSKSQVTASGEMQVVLYVEEPQLVVVRRPGASAEAEEGAAAVNSPSGSSIKASSGLPEGEEVQLLHGMTSSSQSSESYASSQAGRHGQHGQLLSSEDGSGSSPLAHGAGGKAPHSSSSSRSWSWLRPWQQPGSQQQQQQQQEEGGGGLGALVSIAVGGRPQRGSGTNVPLLPPRESP